MNPNTSKQSIEERVAAAIKAGEVAMRPKWHFVLKAALGICGSLLLLLAIVHILSLAIFVSRQNGIWAASAFGLKGLGLLLSSIPWLMILVGIVFVILLEVLVKKYAFAYRRPLIYSVLSIVIFTSLFSVAVAESTFHENLERRAHDGNLPVAGPMYKHMERSRPKKIHPGVLVEFKQNGFTMDTRFGVRIAVATSSDTLMPSSIELKPKDTIVVIGKKNRDTIEAAGIKPTKRRLHCVRCHKQKRKPVTKRQTL